MIGEHQLAYLTVVQTNTPSLVFSCRYPAREVVGLHNFAHVVLRDGFEPPSNRVRIREQLHKA